jgi:hypothetical protein
MRRWNQCDRCHKFLPAADFCNGNASREAIHPSPDDVPMEDGYKTECAGERKHQCDYRAHIAWAKDFYD